MARRSSPFNVRACPVCGREIIDVNHPFTGASFPVDADPVVGFVLEPPVGERKRNAIAEEGEVYVPHVQTCQESRP